MKWFAGCVGAVLLLPVIALPQVVQTASNLIGPCWVVDVKDGDTFRARLPDESVIDVRYMGMSAPETGQELGPESWERNEELLTTGTVWLELESTADGYLADRDGRILAQVFVDKVGSGLNLIQEELIREGLGILDLRGLIDRDLVPGAFPIRYVDRLITAQMDAASERRGLWSLPAFSPDSELVIAAIKFWSDEETVYLINRGSAPIELAEDWFLKDTHAMEHEGSRNTLEFKRYFGPACSLPPGGVVRIYTGPDTLKDKRGTLTGCETDQVEFWWFGYTVWDNAGDTCFLFAPDGSQYSHYAYPPFKDIEKETE